MNDIIHKRLAMIYRGSAVKRFHTISTICENTVGQHSFGVAWLYYLISPQPSLQGVMTALSHDLAEYKTGDVPAPAKRELGIRVQFAEYEKEMLGKVRLDFGDGMPRDETWALKLADSLDGFVFCAREVKMGNELAQEAYDNFGSYIDELCKDPTTSIEYMTSGRKVTSAVMDCFVMRSGL